MGAAAEARGRVRSCPLCCWGRRRARSCCGRCSPPRRGGSRRRGPRWRRRLLCSHWTVGQCFAADRPCGQTTALVLGEGEGKLGCAAHAVRGCVLCAVLRPFVALGGTTQRCAFTACHPHCCAAHCVCAGAQQEDKFQDTGGTELEGDGEGEGKWPGSTRLGLLVPKSSVPVRELGRCRLRHGLSNPRVMAWCRAHPACRMRLPAACWGSPGRTLALAHSGARVCVLRTHARRPLEAWTAQRLRSCLGTARCCCCFCRCVG